MSAVEQASPVSGLDEPMHAVAIELSGFGSASSYIDGLGC